MAEFTEHEKALLQQLNSDDRWGSILDKLRRLTRSEYKPSGSETEDAKFHRWIYESGRNRENAELISILKLEIGAK